jgi:opacity protein-like surface antigen
MKKIIFAALLLAACSISSYSQKGSVLLYGTLSFNSTQTAADTKTTAFGIIPGVGYQFSDHLTLGVNLGYTYSLSTPATGSSLPSLNTFSAGPFIRYSCNVSNVFSFFTQFNTDYLNTTQSGSPSITGFDAKIFPAFCANIKNGLSLVFSFGSLGFTTSKASGAANSASNFGLAFGSGASFGISKHFGGMKK